MRSELREIAFAASSAPPASRLTKTVRFTITDCSEASSDPGTCQSHWGRSGVGGREIRMRCGEMRRDIERDNIRQTRERSDQTDKLDQTRLDEKDKNSDDHSCQMVQRKRPVAPVGTHENVHRALDDRKCRGKLDRRPVVLWE